MNWTVPKIWQDGDVWILGGGPSVTKLFGIPDEIVDQVRCGKLSESAYSPYMKLLHDKHVIGINMAYRIGDWMDMVFFGDSRFMIEFKNELVEWRGLKVSCAPSARKFDWVRLLERDRSVRRGISRVPNAVSWNGNSGAAAISVAVHAGAKRIFLLGFDMKLGADQKQHWHGVYTRKKQPNAPKNMRKLPFHKHLEGFPKIATDAKQLGVEIYNVCPDSAITSLPKITLEQAFEMCEEKERLAQLEVRNKPIVLPVVKIKEKSKSRVNSTINKDVRILCFFNHYYNPNQIDGFKGGSTVSNSNRSEIVHKALDALRAIPNCDVKVCGLSGFTVLGVEVDIDFTGIKPWHLVYESLHYMRHFTEEYDYFINIEDDILLNKAVLHNVMEFDKLRKIDEVFLPNRIEIDGKELRFVDLKNGWKKDQNIIYKGRVLKIAKNFHSAILILSTKKYKYGYPMLDANFREIWWGGPMASAYAYFHIPFKLYRDTELTMYHSVEHLDHWRCYDTANKNYLQIGVDKIKKAEIVINEVLKNKQTIAVKIPYGLHGTLAEAYNKAIEDSTANWVLLLDHDVFVSCNPHWYEMCVEAVQTVSDKTGIITCVSNPRHNKNKGSQWADITVNSSNIDDHVWAAEQLYRKYGETLREVKTHKVAGFFMLVRKSIWSKIRFKNIGKGVDLIDWDFCERLLKKGYRIFELPGLYVYHRRDVRKLDWGKPQHVMVENEKLPLTFSEWIHYYMKYPYANYQYDLFIDKHKVKTLVEPVVNVAKEFAYFITIEEIDEFDYSTLPASFVIKAVHGSHMNIVVQDGVEQQTANQKQSRPFNLPEAKIRMKQWLEIRFADGGELYYDEVDRGVFIEENLCEHFTDYERENGIVDYKAWCFKGKIEFIATANYNGTKVNYYDTDWNEMPFRRDDKTTLVKFPKPENLDNMIETYHKLSDMVGNPPFVRIDLYNFGDKIFFGEFTHSPGKGDKAFIPINVREPKDKYEIQFGKAVVNNGLTIVCFKWEHTVGEPLPAVARGIKYTAEYINKLYHSIERNISIPHRFVCVTDDPKGIECETYPLWDWGREYGKCFTRLKMFDPMVRKIFGKRVVCIDVDTVVTGNLDNIFSRKEDFIIHTYYPDKHGYKQKYNGSLFMMDIGCRPQVYEKFKGEESIQLIKKLQDEKKLIGSDQGWINYVLGDNENRFTEKDGIYHLRNIMQPLPCTKRRRGVLPKETKLVMFSGNQDPSMGLYMNKLDWVTNNWVL